ncbi:hypothetical protein A1F97_08673 [Pyrenophora tritici-repentis]|uniref:DUF7791 domain-containing protein n=3 Tax=Pyrenophora tritici-repentis TaxID=45151 RepID=A0A2W1FTW8_9PLEO|nr:hypothetical protein PtrM4_052730 [Pyrenophora tritici-repentis]KAI1573314.1 hypothetical protein PtrEW7m1_007196 [Pyrenophora tritici-repentis]PZD26125.1 hypothetical protein A1F96_07869 [Pyrenophora tritici-repentis]PZD35372.1 hypothetical protein A1F97_08673 [Pyrenophora tritici-repentis]
MRDLSIRLDPPTTEPKSDDERTLRSLNRECRQLSEQILSLLEKISPSDPKSSRQVMRATLRSFKYKREKEDLENKLTTYRGQLLLHLHRVTRNSLDMTSQFDALRKLEYTNQDVLQALPKQIERLKHDIHIDRLSPEAQEQIRSLLAMTESAKAMITHRVIMKRLAFEHMGARYDQVDRAHCETFRWIVDEDAVVDEKVSQAKLVSVSNFFWRPGKSIQRSFSGMVQSLLYGILDASPDLTSIAFPDLSRQIQAEMSLGLEQWPIDKDMPFDDTLCQSCQQASQVVIKQVKLDLLSPTYLLVGNPALCALERLLRDENVQTSHRFCFFVDALDEYEDTIFRDYRYMVERLHFWVNISNSTLKICVSSREYNVFENMFTASQRIRMQDLTQNDMQRYVNDRLKDILDIGDQERITDKVVDRSDGIFFWVVLVVKTLRESVEDGHDIVRFEKELDILLTEMEELSQYLLDSITPHRRQAAYSLFAILFRAREKKGGLTLSSCLYLEDLDQDIYFAEKLKLACLERDCSKLRNDVDRLAAQNAKATKLAQSYCKGLLESQHRLYEDCGRNITKLMILDFTHRSVPEFFAKNKVQDIIKEHTSGFDIDNAICQLTLADLRCSEYIDLCTPLAVKALKWLYDKILAPRKTDPSFTFLLAVDTTIDRIKKLPMTTHRKGIEELDKYPIDPEFSEFDTQKMVSPYVALLNPNVYLLSPVYVFALKGRPGYTKWRLAQNSDFLDTVLKNWILVDCLMKASISFGVDPFDPSLPCTDLAEEAFREDTFMVLKSLLETEDAMYPQTWFGIMKSVLEVYLKYGEKVVVKEMKVWRKISRVYGRLIEMFLLTYKPWQYPPLVIYHSPETQDLKMYIELRRNTNGAAIYIDCRGFTDSIKKFFNQFPNTCEIPIEEVLPHMEFENIDAIMCAIEKVKAAGRTCPPFTWDTPDNLVEEGQSATAKSSEPDSLKHPDPPTEPPTAPLVERASSEPGVYRADPPIEPSTVPLLEYIKAPHEPAITIGSAQEISKPDHRRTYMAIWLFGICLSLVLGIKARMLYV